LALVDVNCGFNLTPLVFKIFQCIAFVSVLSLTTQGVLAQETPKNNEPEKIKIGDEYYTRGQIIADFLNVAFSEMLWNEDTGDDFIKLLDFKLMSRDKQPPEYENLKRTAPWLADFMHRPGGIPKNGVVTKWPADISIGIGWPFYTIGSQYKTSPYNEKGSEKYTGKIESSVTSLLPVIANATKRNVVFYSAGDMRDGSINYARIRIIPLRSWDKRGWVKAPKFSWLPYDNEENLWGAIPLEVSDPENIDAYLLPDKNNNLGLSICKINPEVGAEKLKELIEECLVRSIGLPGRSQNKESYLLSAQEARKKIDYDAFLMTLLYCPDIKTGMSKNEIIDLFTKKKCIY